MNTKIVIWNTITGNVIKIFYAHIKDVVRLTISHNEKYFLSGSEDNTIKIWDFQTFENIQTLSGHNSGVWIICVHPNEKYIISGSDDQTVKIWKYKYSSSKTIKTIFTFKAPVESLSINKNGKFFVAGS